jgi:hypothetical protein
MEQSNFPDGTPDGAAYGLRPARALGPTARRRAASSPAPGWLGTILAINQLSMTPRHRRSRARQGAPTVHAEQHTRTVRGNVDPRPATNDGLAPFLFWNEIAVSAHGAALACPSAQAPICTSTLYTSPPQPTAATHAHHRIDDHPGLRCSHRLRRRAPTARMPEPWRDAVRRLLVRRRLPRPLRTAQPQGKPVRQPAQRAAHAARRLSLKRATRQHTLCEVPAPDQAPTR